MQKIMFSDKFGLTQAVIDGRKTMTRRLVSNVPCFAYKENGVKKHGGIEDMEIRCGDTLMLKFRGDWYTAPNECQPRYKIGETIAVAQSYKDVGYAIDTIQEGRAVRKGVHPEDWDDSMKGKFGAWYIDQLPGWNNKMFTCPEMMPHQIRITDIKVERLQEISEEDCFKEGVELSQSGIMLKYFVGNEKTQNRFKTPHEAFAALIDRVSGKGTFDRNPLVFVYEFELVK